jgi:hypothetical protein
VQQESPIAIVANLGAASLGVFRGSAAESAGVSRKQLTAMIRDGIVVRDLPDTYRMTAVASSSEQRLRSALIWAGAEAGAAGRSAGEILGLQAVHAERPEIVAPRTVRTRALDIIVHHSDDRNALMMQTIRGIRVTGVEATLVSLAHSLEPEALEIACEDGRRRRLTSVPALRAYLTRFGRPGRREIAPLRRLLDQLDPVHPSRSMLEVKARRLLVANGITDFVREFPLDWMGRTYLLRLRVRTEPYDPRDQRPAVARRPEGLRARQRKMEPSGATRLSHRLRDLGKGHEESRAASRRARRDPPDRPQVTGLAPGHFVPAASL